MARDTRRGGKKKVSKNIAAGVAHVNSSFNNTKILISDVARESRERFRLSDDHRRRIRALRGRGGRRDFGRARPLSKLDRGALRRRRR